MQAKDLFRQALPGRETRLGDSHPQTPWTAESLANISRSEALYTETEQLHSRALNGRLVSRRMVILTYYALWQILPTFTDLKVGMSQLEFCISKQGRFLKCRHVKPDMSCRGYALILPTFISGNPSLSKLHTSTQ